MHLLRRVRRVVGWLRCVPSELSGQGGEQRNRGTGIVAEEPQKVASFEQDQVRRFDCDGIRVLVDPASLRYVDGSTVDYTESLMGAGFQVNNPNVVAACGCGSSFRVADEEPSCS